MRYFWRALVFVSIFLLLGGFILWDNCAIQTEQITVELSALPENFEGLRIAVLSDLHGRQFGHLNRTLLTKVAAAKPDLICICGDVIDEDKDLSVLPALIEGLCKLAPTYFVSGNHEWQLKHPQEVLASIEALGAVVLRNEFAVLERQEQCLVIAGVDDPCGPRDQKSPRQVVEELPKGICTVMLDHRNDRLAMWSELGVDLVLSGHCHGGVVRIPLIGGVFGTNRELFPDFDSGIYEKNGTKLFVSRGLGYTNVRLRLFNRPQLAVLTLVNNS